jgi:aldose 1-epimerase
LIGALKLKKTQGEGEVPQLGAISMEFSEWPDSVNHPEWRNRQTLWDSEHIFTGFATYKFSVAGKRD